MNQFKSATLTVLIGVPWRTSIYSNPKDNVNPSQVRMDVECYRANACPPPGDRVCAFCGSSRNVEVGHLDGHEENTAPENLIWNCRA